MSKITADETIVGTSHPYKEAFLSLAVLTVVEIIVGYFESTILVISLLGILAVAKVAIIVAIFMHVAYEKDTKQIIFFAFLIPLIGVLLLTATITLDYRNY